MRLLALLAVVPFAIARCVAAADDSSPVLPVPGGDTIATDDLGRTLPTPDQTGPPRADRWVGLFYWQWHGAGERWWKQYDVTKFLKDRPYFRDFEVRPANGPKNPTWYWAEPLFGYYRSTDPWVIRKHLVMLADAGVDFLFLDCTNSSAYDAELTTLLNVARELKAAGVAVPKLTFFIDHPQEWEIHSMYVNWYSKPEWQDMWFRWRGKPLLLAAPIADAAQLRPGQDAALLPAINNYFTFRRTGALDQFDGDPTVWQFVSDLKAKAAVDPQGRPEQIVVNKSNGGPFDSNMAVGGASAVFGQKRTKDDFTPQWTRPESAQGVFIQQAWANAEEKNVPIALVTGWNQWKASVKDRKGVPWFGVPVTPPYGYFADEFNEEFNRDLEPMAGGCFDAYYLQFLASVRNYKGMPAPQPASPHKTITLDGRSDDWVGVTPKYVDPPNDAVDRDHDAAVPDPTALLAADSDAACKKLPSIRYVSRTARNDIAFAQVARDDDYVYFHATTAKPLSPATDAQWMWLLVDTDRNPDTGWQGFDLLINRTRDGHSASIERCVGKSFEWLPTDTAKIAVGSNAVELAVPRGLLGGGPARFDFKWADNLPAAPTVADFYTTGDVAPNTRLKFRYDETRR